VVQGKRPLAVLESIVEQISAESLGLDREVIHTWGPSVKRGVVFVQGRGSDAQQFMVAERLRQRFGDAVELEWNTHFPMRFA
jgi:hypothetical protein